MTTNHQVVPSDLTLRVKALESLLVEKLGTATDAVPLVPAQLIAGRQSTMGWPSGTSMDSQDTLAFSVLTGVRSINQVFPLKHAAEAYDLMMSGKARFRVVLTTGH